MKITNEELNSKYSNVSENVRSEVCMVMVKLGYTDILKADFMINKFDKLTDEDRTRILLILNNSN